MTKDYEFSDLANIFPLIEGDEFLALIADIRENGLREGITLDEDGRILDGRNRYKACKILGIEPYAEVYSGDNPLELVISLNLRRRHLTDSQRAMIAARIANLSEGRPSKTVETVTVSQSQAAAMMSVSRETVSAATQVQKHAVPELQKAVDDGRVSVNAAGEIASLPVPEQEVLVARGEKEIMAKAKEIRAVKSAARREERDAEIVEKIVAANPLPTDRKYALIYADPPWRYEVTPMGDTDRSIENHYPTMTLEEICALPVPKIAHDDCLLLLWATVPNLPAAFTVLDRWGFTYRSCLSGDKEVRGTGFWFRNQHEILIVATRGDIRAPAPEQRISSVLHARRGQHSEKPVEIAEWIERAFPTYPRIELFCRTARPGWAIWGNMVDPTDVLAAYEPAIATLN